MAALFGFQCAVNALPHVKTGGEVATFEEMFAAPSSFEGIRAKAFSVRAFPLVQVRGQRDAFGESSLSDRLMCDERRWMENPC